MPGIRKTRAELTTTGGAPFRAANTPTAQDFLDLVTSLLNLKDDNATAVAVDDNLQALINAYFPGAPHDAPDGAHTSVSTALSLVLQLASGGTTSLLQDSLYLLRKAGTVSNVKVVCLGTNITAGVTDAGGVAATPFPARLQALLQQYYVAGGNVSVVNAGHAGDTSADLITRFAAAVTAQNPALIVIEAGINDCLESSGIDVATYRANMTLLLNMCGSIPVVIVGIPPIFTQQEGHVGEGVVRFYREALHEIAGRRGLCYVDVFQRLHSLYKSRGISRGQMSKDGVNYAQAGHTLLGDIVFMDGFCNEDIRIKPGQFKDAAGQWICQVTPAAAVLTGSAAGILDKTRLRLTNTLVYAYLYLEDYVPCSLVLHSIIDRVLSTTQQLSITNTSIAGAAATTYNLVPKVAGASTNWTANDYPIVTCKLKPGLNIIKIDATGAGITGAFVGVSVLASEDALYEDPYYDATGADWASANFTAADYRKSIQAFSILRNGVLTVRDSGNYVEPYFRIVPEADGATTRWKFRGVMARNAGFYFGQASDDTPGYRPVYKLKFDGTNAILSAWVPGTGYVQVISVAVAVATTGTIVHMDITSGPTGWSIWESITTGAATLLYTDNVPLSICQVFVFNEGTLTPVYMSPPMKKGPNVADTGGLAGELYYDPSTARILMVAAGGGVSVTLT